MGGQKTFPQEALRADYAILAPDSGETPRSGVRQWDCMHRIVERSEDLLFFRDLLNWVKKNDWARLDAGRVYVAGISSGGFMASRLVLKYFRPWEGANKALDTYTLHLNISK
ncbi:MAG: hypothetical protein NT106_14710 [Candidatus Sumerlaeota bacterium]|nr:hypothetical protein [Candidatus Sumerlaeota bacterium]